MSQNSLRRSRRILFLDRDDTIIKDFGYLNDPDQVIILDGLIDALKVFRNLGFDFIVTTNQSGLTRGSVQFENMNAIHKKIQFILNQHGLRILNFYYAPYLHDHQRRKPGEGLIKNAAQDYNIDFQKSFFAGDKWRDLIGGYNLGAKTILVNEAQNQKELFTTFKPDIYLKTWKDFSLTIFNSAYNKSNEKISSSLSLKKSNKSAFKKSNMN